MKKSPFLLFIFVVVLIFPLIVTAQTAMRDVVYLKNGNIIKGTILGIVPNESLRIETLDGSIYNYTMSDVDKITKESYQPAAVAASAIEELQGASFSLYGGSSATIGNFSEEGETWQIWTDNIFNSSLFQNPGFSRSGSARGGLVFGLQFVTGGTIGWVINAAYTENEVSHAPAWRDPNGSSVDLSTDKWKSFLALTGIKFGTDNSTAVNFFFAPLVGVLFSNSPEIKANLSNPSYSYIVDLKPTSAKALAYGAQCEFTFWHYLTAGARFVMSNPKYTITCESAFGATTQNCTIDHTQKILLLFGYAGISF